MEGTRRKGPEGSPKARYLRNRQDEVDSAALYRVMADQEASPELARVYRRLAEVEERHAAFWERQLQGLGAAVPPRTPGWRSRVLGFLARRLGARWVLPSMANMEQVNRHVYDGQPEAAGTGMPAQERSHARLLRAMAGPRGAGSGLEGSAVARLEGRHRTMGGNALRAAVLGANDGLVSNLSLVMGVAGARLSSHALLVTGIAGLLAGAISMALGEWISVQSSRELHARQLSVEAEELAQVPDEEREELELIYQAKGVPKAEAHELASRIMAEPAAAMDALAREELGIDPNELGGSAWTASLTSFFLFAGGALVPVLPFTFLNGPGAVAASVLVSALALFFTGAVITLFTGRRAWTAGLRQLVAGLLACGVTFGLGRLVGGSISG